MHALVKLASVVLISALVLGCQQGSKQQDVKQYPLRGTVKAVDSAKNTVTIDHEDIPGLMPAMTMDFKVDSSSLLESIKAGDQVQGKLSVTADNKQTITELRKLSEKEEEEAEIEAERAKLSPELRKLVDAQDFCPIQQDSRLGSMGPPIKLMVKDKPVFICCVLCKKEALANPDATLAEVEKLKAKKKTQ